MCFSTTEISKRKSLTLNVAHFCAELLLGERVYFIQSSVTGTKNKLSMESLFLTLTDKEAEDIKKYKKHPRLEGSVTFKGLPDSDFCVSEISFRLYTSLEPGQNPHKYDSCLYYKLGEDDCYQEVGKKTSVFVTKNWLTKEHLDTFIQKLLESK